MLPIKTIIKRLRKVVHDTDEINYDDEEILAVINNGLRFIRRTIAEVHPETLMTTVHGTLEPGEDTIELSKRPLQIIRVKSGDEVLKTVTTSNSPLIYRNSSIIYRNKNLIYATTVTKTYKQKRLTETNLRHIPDDMQPGPPRLYYKTGLKTVHIWPEPEQETGYTIDTIDDIEEVGLEDRSPLLDEFDDFLIEYGALRLAIGNEYDESQETQIMMQIHNQISRMLVPPPPGIVVNGYWGHRRGDYR